MSRSRTLSKSCSMSKLDRLDVERRPIEKRMSSPKMTNKYVKNESASMSNITNLKLTYLRSNFEDVLESEEIISDFFCSLKSDLLCQGRLYICVEKFYFTPKLKGSDTKVSEKWLNVISAKKTKLAHIVPNTICITTKDTKYYFTSLASRSYPVELINYAIKNQKEDLNIPPLEIKETVKNNLLRKYKKLSPGASQMYNSTCNLNTLGFDWMEGDVNVEKSDDSGNNASWELPIDASDNKELMGLKKSPMSCSCVPLKNLVLKKIFDVNIDDLFLVLNDDKSPMMKKIYEKNHFENYDIISCETMEDGTVIKKASTTLPNAFMGKTAKTCITQAFPNTNIPNKHYQVNTKSITDGVPFSETFEIICTSCLRKCGENKTDYKSWLEIKFVKEGWMIPKEKIGKNILKTYQTIHDDIILELSALFGSPTDIEPKLVIPSIEITNETGIKKEITYIIPPPKILNYVQPMIHISVFILLVCLFITVYRQHKTIQLLNNKLHNYTIKYN